jgi:hypothetical protein
MIRPSQNCLVRLEELIQRVAEFHGGTSPTMPESVVLEKRELWRFLVSSIQTVSSACGKDSPHLRELERCREDLVSHNTLDSDTCRGVLEAARDDLVAGMLIDLRQLVTAEAFGDLLESAQYLLEEKHHIPAAALAGAVLESSMRALAVNHELEWTGHSSISKLNQVLYSAKIYDKVVFGEIEAWGKLRNQVDHGDFQNSQDVDLGRVARMVDGVRGFVMQYR